MDACVSNCCLRGRELGGYFVVLYREGNTGKTLLFWLNRPREWAVSGQPLRPRCFSPRRRHSVFIEKYPLGWLQGSGEEYVVAVTLPQDPVAGPETIRLTTRPSSGHDGLFDQTAISRSSSVQLLFTFAIATLSIQWIGNHISNIIYKKYDVIHSMDRHICTVKTQLKKQRN